MNRMFEAIMGLPPIMLAAVAIALFVFLFLPSFIAFLRGVKDRFLILWINFVFVWSFVVWTALLGWAGTGGRDEGVLARLRETGRGALVAQVTLAIVVLAAIAAFLVELPRLAGN